MKPMMMMMMMMIIMILGWLPHVAIQEIFPECVWRRLSVFIVRCTTGVQPYPAPESNQSDSDQVRLPKPPLRHTHSTTHSTTFFSS